MVGGMQGHELKFNSPRSSFQLSSHVRISRPCVEAKCLNLRLISVSALWDTGAAVSAISKSAAERVGVKARERAILSTAAGLLPTYNDIVLVNLFIEDYLIPAKVAVVDSVPGRGHDFLIGMDIIQSGDMKISTDHANNTFEVSFKPYHGLFKKVSEILPKFSGNIIEY